MYNKFIQLWHVSIFFSVLELGYWGLGIMFYFENNIDNYTVGMEFDLGPLNLEISIWV
jgi:hypothetical protein